MSLTPDPNTRQKIEGLFSQFEDDSYAVREQATRELATIGSPASDQLRQAMKSPLAEVRWRARELSRRLTGPESAIRLTGHESDLECVTFSPDSKHLATGDKSGMVKVWRVDDWTLVKTMSLNAGNGIAPP